MITTTGTSYCKNWSNAVSLIPSTMLILFTYESKGLLYPDIFILTCLMFFFLGCIKYLLFLACFCSVYFIFHSIPLLWFLCFFNSSVSSQTVMSLSIFCLLSMSTLCILVLVSMFVTLYVILSFAFPYLLLLICPCCLHP